MDIETRIQNNQHIPYLICFYDGTIKKSYWIKDFNDNPEEMIRTIIKNICIKKYDNYKIYMHNLSNFDGIFLLKILSTNTYKFNSF
jgi:hypothetical protein